MDVPGGAELRVDLRVPVGAPLRALAELARRAEGAGLHGLGVHDHHHTGRDAYVTLAAMALATERLALYPATSNVSLRHPLVLAALANSLAELAPGRALLTVAPGFLSVEKAGRPQGRIAELREVVPVLRSLLAGGTAELDGVPLELTHPAPGGAEVLLLASGPRLLELAGEVADGYLALVGLHPGAVAAARAHVAAGAQRAGRDPRTLHEVLIVPIALGPPEETRAWPRRWFREGQAWLRYPSRSNLHWLRHAGIDIPDEHDPHDLSPELAERVCDAYGLFGPPEHCAERLLRARAETGADHVFLFPAHTWAGAYDLPEAEISAFAGPLGGALR